MDGLKSDSETELTSTMGNALSVTNKDEKNDTNDATPTSSTDASTASTSSRIVSDDPISSTSSDTVEQTKATEMSQSVTDLLEMNIPSEKITEDVEDLVHDLESLLGESTDSFSIPSRTPPEERKEAEDVVSQTSGELNEEQEEQIPVTCDADHHSKDSARTLETRLICDVSAEEEKLDLGGSTSKTDTDITSSKRCLQIEEGDDANDLHQTTSNTDSPLEQEIEPAQGVQEKRDIDTDGGTSSKIFDEPQVVLDSGDVEVEDIKTEQEVIDKSEEHVTDTGDHVASEPKSDTNQEVECEKDVSSQTGIEKNDLSGRTESPQEVEGNTVALDEGAADQDIIITSDSDRPDDSIQKSKTDILDKTTTEVPADSNIANSEDLRDKVDEMTSQNIQEITGESEPPADPPGSCLALEVQQSVDDVQDNIEGTDKGVIGSSEEKSENQPELQKDSEEIENETVIGTNEQIESEISNVTVSRIPEIIVSEISEDTVSGSNEETAVSTEDNVLTTDEASSDIKQTSSQEISGDIELSASSPTECTENDNPVEATFAVKNDDVYEEDAEEMSEMIPTQSEISQTVDTSNSEAMNPTEVEGDNPQCATASSSSEVTAIGHHAVVEDNLQSEKIDNEPISDVEGCLIESTVTDCENVRDTQKEDKTKSDHLEETHNQPSVCEQQLDIMEVPNVESLEAVISEQNVPDITESYDMKECADEPLEGISTNPADEEEETVIGRETDKFLCEENRTAIKDGENEKCLENSDDCALSPTQTDAEFALVDPSRSDIPINDTIESHKTVDNVVQIDNIGDIPAEEKEEKELRIEEENTEKIEEQSTNLLKNEEDMNVEDEGVACQVISDITHPSVTDKLAEEMKLKTDDDSLDESYIQDVECSQSYGSVMEKTNSNIQQLAESSGIMEELENDNRIEHTSNEDSIPLPTEMDATSTIDGNEIEGTKDSECEEKSELSPTEDIEKAKEEMLNECTEETLTQPDSTQGIDKSMDDDEKSAVDSPEVVENDEEVKASGTSEASLDNQNMEDVQVAIETVSDGESSPAQSDKPSAVLIESSEDNSNVTGSESKPSKITQLEFAPLVLSEEDSEEEAAPTLRLDENDSEVLGNIKDSQPLPQLDDIIASQPVIVESTAPVDNADMQENLETILAVASLQKIDIPRETESEQVLSETERREMEALRRAVESITDNSVSAYVEEAEALVVESDSCDADASSEQAELMEAIPTEDSVNQVEAESVPKVQEGDEIDNIVQDNTSYRSDVEKHEETTETKLPDSSEPVEYGREQDVMVNKEDTNLETDTVETFEPKSQELETHVDEVASSGQNDKPEINLKTMADSSVVSNEAAGNSEESEPDISTSESAEVAVASEKNTVCQTDDPNLQSTSEETDAPIAAKEEMSSGPIADDTIVQNVPPEEKTLENDENFEEPHEVSPERDENDATVTFSDAGESQGVEAATEENQQEVIEIIPQPTESNEQKDSQQMIENDSTKADLTVESRESGASEKLDERNTTEIYTEATQEREDHQEINEGDNKSQERESAQVVDEYNTEINSEIGELQQGEVLQKVNEQESTEPDGEPIELQERVTVRNVNQQENLETDTEEKEAAQTVDEEGSTETDADLVESQKSEPTEEVKDQDRKTIREEVVRESTETDPEVGGSQEREATQKLDQRKVPQRRTGLRNTLPEQETLIDSSQVTVENEAHPAPVKEKEVKVKTNERPKRHKKADNKLEELSINVDVPDREKPYSPKITIKPIKVPDEEVSTTSNSEAEVTKGSLKMTITKQSDKLHSVLKVCDSENPESTTDVEEPIPKLKIKPKMQQLEQQHSPKMSTRSSNQRSLSPRITIKPVVKPDKQEALSPLKIKIGLKSEETPKKHSSKANSRSASKQEDDTPRKVLIKPVVKPAEESESAVSPRITIKLPKPEVEKDAISPRMNIKAIRKQDEENDEKERSSPKITIKPVVKPHEPDSHPEEGEEVKERIVLKINKGNLPTPTKESKKREHPPDDEKSEKLAKITVKFSKEGGHPHIVQQMEESHKRSHEEPSVPEKNKKQKVEAESTMSTRSRHKEVSHDAPVETKSRHKEHAEGSDSKSKLKDTDTPQFESSRSSKHKDHSQQESPIEPKRTKLKDPLSDFPGRQSRRSSSRSRQREVDAAVADDVQIVEQKLNSPIVISEDSRSQDSASVILVEDSKEEATMNLTPRSVGSDSPRGTPKSDSVASTPSTTPTPRKRGRPRKVPIEVREEFKEQDEPPVKTKPKQQLQVQQQEEGEASAPQQQQQQQSAPSSSQETGRPKRSCRGPSVCDRLGIKPRQPRGGPGRGRGGKRGVGTRPTPMKPEKSSK